MAKRANRSPRRGTTAAARTRARTSTKAPSKPAPAPESEPDAGDVHDKRYYRIGEVSRITDVKPYVLRYWESEFRWMAPQKSRSKQRLYRRRDIDMILLIKKLLYEQRFTIAGARKKLRGLGVGKALESGNLLVEDDQRARFQRIREELHAIRAML